MFGKRKTPSKNDPVVVEAYTKSGKKEIVSLDSPKAARKFLNRIAKEHDSDGAYVRDTPNGLTVTDANGKPVTHYQIKEEK